MTESAPKPPDAAVPEPPAAPPPAAPPPAAPPPRVAVRRDGFPHWPENSAQMVPAAAKPTFHARPQAVLARRVRAGRPLSTSYSTGDGSTDWSTDGSTDATTIGPTNRSVYRSSAWLSARRPSATARPWWRGSSRQRRPATGLAGLLLLALLAAFFGWVSADPFWLAVGHAETGTATVTRCAGSGLGARCVGTFTAPGLHRERVALSALPPAAHHPGVVLPARMVSAGGRIAYAGNPAALHLRWVLGITLVVLCGLGIGWVTGAGRLADRRARTAGYATSVAAPLLLLIGMLIVSW